MATASLHFDPDCHPDDTLKAFNEFIIDFELRYAANYPDPPKVSLEAALSRWKVENEDTKVSPDQYDTIVDSWKSKDKVAKFLGLFSSRRLYSDWVMAVPNDGERKSAGFEIFVKKLQAYYKPTENLTLKNFQFRALSQEKSETFIAFCNRVEKEAKHCEFRCESASCSAEMTAIRDQVVIGMVSESIREEALKQSWSLSELRTEGMRLESATKSASEISGENLNKLGKYSFKNTKKASSKARSNEPANCYRCGFSSSWKEVIAHAKTCPAKSSTCSKCNKVGHDSSVCRGEAQVNEVNVTSGESNDEPVYNVNVFRLKSNSSSCNDFQFEMIINNHFDSVLADTGATVSVCGSKQAERWGLLDRISKSNVKIKPYRSQPIPTLGTSTCAVSVGSCTVPVQWHIINEDCEPVLSGKKAVQLGLIKLNPKSETLMPINMIKCKDKKNIQDILAEYPENFDGLGKLKDHVVKLHVNEEAKPTAEPPRRIPYHLESRVQEVIDGMLQNEVIEEHPSGEPAPWASNIVIAPKDDGDIRITLDAKNVNKAILSSSYPIPRQEDIKAKLAGSKVFSKLDLKSAFWQLELDERSRPLTVFHALGKMYRYKRLVMGLKPAQGELNAAMQSLFSHMPEVHVIHDDIVVGTPCHASHERVLREVMIILSKAGLTLNSLKCVFGANEIRFWGLIFSADGVRPDPEKVDALSHLTAPTNKDDLISFLCMMQSNAEFIPDFARKAALLRELTRKSARFCWQEKHETCFKELIDSFRKDTLLRFFDLDLPSFVFVDGHRTGFGAILAQGKSIEDAKPVALASRTTSQSEMNYPQIDLEASSVDLALRRFSEYLIGSPRPITVVTDHKPLVPVFNDRRKGSIRAQRIKLNHQNIPYVLQYHKGSANISDFMSRHGKPLHMLTIEQQKESEESSNLLYMLHSTQVVDRMGIGHIATETLKDETLSKIQAFIRKGQTTIPRQESDGVRKFAPIMHELTLAANGIVMKQDRMVLPESLQSTAIELAHRGSHPGRSGIERRLRYHFFFHNMFDKVKEFVESCETCSVFVDKKTKEPIRSHKVPGQCWETVAVDLFGPMPSSKHVVVVQDIGSRFPAAKLVSSTKAEKVIPVLDEIYNTFGNPDVQISDNGPPFNSKSMKEFAEKRGIEARFVPPHFPNANPSETFMKTLGKGMKSAHHNHLSEKEVLQKTLSNHRQTPHPATNLPPSAMIFRDGMRAEFPRRTASDEEVASARERDKIQKETNEEKVNNSKYRKYSEFQPGELVLLRNFEKTSKFHPVFKPHPHVVLDVDPVAKKLLLESTTTSRRSIRHPDDVKLYHGKISPDSEAEITTPCDQGLPHLCEDFTGYDEYAEEVAMEPLVEPSGEGPRRSNRSRVPNQRYYNADMSV